MSARRYAWMTKVPVEKSQAELMALLGKHGVTDLATSHSLAKGSAIRFRIGDRWFELAIPRPAWAEIAKEYERTVGTMDDNIEQEYRRRWRAHLMLLKMKLEFIESGESTVESEFLSSLLLANGQTLGAVVRSNGIPLLTATT